MAKMNIKRDDMVRVISGKDRFAVVSGKEIGIKEGKVLKVIPQKQRVVVEKANMIKKHMHPTKNNPDGGIVSMEAPIHVSNVMLVCPHCSTPTRVGVVRDENGKKVRVCKKCNKNID